jgi:hypothetical protein
VADQGCRDESRLRYSARSERNGVSRHRTFRELEPIVLKPMIRLKRTRVTITGLIFTVVFCAVILRCIVETRRIKRAQAFFGQMASIYSQREALERSKISDSLGMAQFYKRMAEKEKESIEWLGSRVGRHLGDVEIDIRRRVKFYNESVASQRQSLLHAREARIKADRFAILKQTYAEAASCLWLPFAPSPLAVRHPENGGRASSVKRRLPADEADEADRTPTEGIDEPEKPAKPDVGGTPPRVDISVRPRGGQARGDGLPQLLGVLRSLDWGFAVERQRLIDYGSNE